jgi:predicted DNA binding CopG/RHH family protein
MKRQYDFSKSKSNPYAKKLKQQITIRVDTTAISYFKECASELGIPYQTLIDLFLSDCAKSGKRPRLQW